VSEAVGWAGSFLLSICGVPLVWEAVKKGVTPGYLFLGIWGVGEVCMIIYTPWEHEQLHINYLLNCVCIGVTLYCKWRKP
jgi:thiamine transporter ThiT